MILPILLSVPHAGLEVPLEARSYCRLTHDEIVKDGDEGAVQIYDLAEVVAEFVTTDVARAIVNLNRAENDRREDGVVKTYTIWNVPVYHDFPPPDVIEQLLYKYYRPYHTRLSAAVTPEVKLGVDCHTMASAGPPIGPDPGRQRPEVCLGDVNGATLCRGWMERLATCFRNAFDGFHVAVNQPFSGGYITRAHGREMPWVQLELSRGEFLNNYEKRSRVLEALAAFCAERLPPID